MPKVLIIQARLPGFRVPFFTKLHEALCKDGVDLTVAYSRANRSHALRQDDAELPAEFGYKVHASWLGERFIYQPLWREIMQADLTIVGPENKYLNNLWLLPLSALRLKTVAYWGLGPHMHPDRRSAASEWLKGRSAATVDWWFAYTESVAANLSQHGVLEEKITVVQNATDTVELRRLLSDIPDEEVAQGRRTLTGNLDSKIGFYCGRLDSAKALPFLIDSARIVRRRCPQFHLVIVGSGPERPWLEQAASAEPWIHYLGSQWGRDSALLYKMADVFLLAGTAGLAIVDSFAAGLPLIGTELPNHPPEISYLRDRENGMITPHEPEDYAKGIAEVFESPGLLAKLRRGATLAGARYTIEAMVENFRLGINRCLAQRRVSAQHEITRQSMPRTQD
jgi:glycosyltransferase involved in cell wall biosynthesis